MKTITNNENKSFLYIESLQEYKTIKRKYNKHKEAQKQYLKENKTNSIPAEIAKTFPFAKLVINDITSAIEEFEFLNFPPEKYFVYINPEKNTVTTWTGQKLGNLFSGRSYRSNFGDIRVPISFITSSGIEYHGTFYRSAGDYATVKIAKKFADKVKPLPEL